MWTSYDWRDHGFRECTVISERAGMRRVQFADGVTLWLKASYVHQSLADAELAAKTSTATWHKARGKAPA